MADEEVYPLNLLSEELKNEDTEVRIKSMKRIKTVAQALGPERTRLELIPFLNEATEDEDEVLVALSEELGGFVDLVGGPNHASCLLEPLEALAAVEETVVRDKAVHSIVTITLSLTNVTESIVPMIKRLAEGDWFTSRVSACSLFASAYPKISAAGGRKELRELYGILCNDDTPMVRRSAASNLGKFATAIEKEHVIGSILQLFKTMTTDDQDSVRLLAIENCASMSAILSEEENRQHLLPLIKSSCEDRSWRVRFSIAKNFHPICEALGELITKNELVSSFTLLLQDAEAEVRAASTKNAALMADLIGVDDFNSEILPMMNNLAQDTAPNVRTATSIVAMELAPKLGQSTTKEHLLPLYLSFLRDEVVDVRLNVLKRMSALAEWAPSMEATLLPAVVELSRDLQWRVREAVISTFPALAGNMGTDYFRENLLTIYLTAFTDMVGQVRTSTTEILEDLLGAVGSDWILENIIPKLTEMFDRSQVYQERVNVLQAFKQLACDKASTALLNEMTQVAIRGARDNIPNVRVGAAKTLEDLSKHAGQAIVSSQVRPCLAELQSDSDSDVRYYACVALESMG